MKNGNTSKAPEAPPANILDGAGAPRPRARLLRTHRPKATRLAFLLRSPRPSSVMDDA